MEKIKPGWIIGCLLTIFLAVSCTNVQTSPTPNISETISSPISVPVLPTPTPTASTPVPPASQAVETQTPPPACTNPTGQVMFYRLESKEQRPLLGVRVYQPPCYPQAGVLYPTLYLLHGQGFTEEQWQMLGATQTAEKLILKGDLPPFIIVMPFEALSGYGPDESHFDQIVVDELIPWVDDHYNTCARRECRAVGGLSRGAGWALRLGMQHWQLFSAVGLHSITAFLTDPESLPVWLKAIPADQYPSIYMDIGLQDTGWPDAVQIEKTFNLFSVPHEWYLFKGTHSNDYWSAHLETYLHWYARQFHQPGS
jgi:enterochelin esterase-like enzyme